MANSFAQNTTHKVVVNFLSVATRVGLRLTLTIALVAPLFSGCANDAPSAQAGPSVSLLNASYDPTRELYRELNEAFTQAWTAEHPGTLEIRQSHGASGSQARAVIDGLEADVVSLALWTDTDAIRKKGLITPGWEDRLPHRSLPYHSTIVFVVRKGNPKNVRDWPDLVRGNISIIAPNPKTSGNGKLAFLAAWGSVIKGGGDEEAARDFVTRLYSRIPVLDTGARGSTTTFAQKGIGDVHLTWESEAQLEIRESGGELELVYPTTSFLAEPHVALVDAVVDRRQTREVAEAYLQFLYSAPAQQIIARNHYRPNNPEVMEEHRAKFPAIDLIRITDVAANWDEAQGKFFAEGGVFDVIYQPGPERPSSDL
jgi:sulfate transport system substrate-binding protein